MKSILVIAVFLSFIIPNLVAADKSSLELETGTLKYKVEPEYYTLVHNPASLAFINTDSFFFYMGQEMATPDDLDDMGGETQLVDGYYIKERNAPMKAGYVFPIGNRMGFGIQYSGGSYNRYLNAPSFFDYQGAPFGEMAGFPDNNGGALSIGYSILDDMSLGISAGTWISKSNVGGENYEFMYEDGNYFFINAGYMLKNIANHHIFGFSASYNNQIERYLDISQLTVEDGTLPLTLEADILSDFFNRLLFTSLTAISDIYIDGRGVYVFRLIPVIEYHPFTMLSIRAGGEFSYLYNKDDPAMGYGFLTGLSIKIKRLELNTNFTIRRKPSRSVPGAILSDRYLTVGFTLNPGIINRH
ncbi:MAG: hypothetical protein KAH95_18035 [Spirochaetales bacterium]|nr:hypothetical protein [Spirochaetales bacterium]